MGTMMNPMPPDSKCPKCGVLMQALEQAHGLPTLGDEQRTALVLTRCPKCNFVEFYLPRR
jgi:predicted nucleic-acid-binding Zn-ribbon protein